MELQLETIRAQITDIINNSQLPVGAAYYLFKDIYRDIEQCYKEALEACKHQQPEEMVAEFNADKEELIVHKKQEEE